MKKLLIATVGLASTLFAVLPAQADWVVDEASRIGFVSIKNNVVGENNAFERVSGRISGAGAVAVNIDLTSVETGVGIRNERLQKMLFNVASFPKATVSAQLTQDQLNALESGGSAAAPVLVAVTLHGNTVSKMADLAAARTGDTVRVTTTQPIVISASEFGLEAGVAALQSIAGLNAISRSIPVTVDLQLIAAD
jgi:polyisoprenoid-binding protein YceI